MLVPQNQQLCQRCGRLPASPTALCPSCGTPLAPPWPSQNHFPSTPFTPAFAPVPRPNYTPLVVELLLNFLGIYGVGWLMIGNKAGGMTLFIGSIVLWLPVFLLNILTLGLVLLCLGPVAIGAIVCNAIVLQQAIARKGC